MNEPATEQGRQKLIDTVAKAIDTEMVHWAGEELEPYILQRLAYDAILAVAGEKDLLNLFQPDERDQ